MTLFVEFVAVVCLVWSLTVVVVQTIGVTAILRCFSRRPSLPLSPKLGRDAPRVTVIRPVKGLEPGLYDCIASTFRQDYPLDKVSIRLCVEDRTDAAYPVLTKILEDFPAHDAQVLVEAEDPVLHGSSDRVNHLGPNPKIRNISRAYREAKGDIIWVMDCNVWVSSNTLGRMVDKMMGYTAPGAPPVRPYKIVHQMPVVVDAINYRRSASAESQSFLSSTSDESAPMDRTVAAAAAAPGTWEKICKNAGGRLDEMFMATTHAKFYGAINTVGIAPCLVGKSNMFRKSHLDKGTDPSQNPLIPKGQGRPSGVDYFSHNICEDHLIGDLLWRFDIPGFDNHGIMWGDLVLQPMAGMSIVAYAARRIRWLRARKFTVLAATLVEPGVESFLCCAYLAFAVTTLPWFRETLGIQQTWSSMALVWLVSVTAWMLVDRVVFRLLHTGCTVDMDQDTPDFAKGTANAGPGAQGRSFLEWLAAWIGREALALPIWTWAVLLGTTVNWRGKTFYVRLDTSVEELPAAKGNGVPARTTQTPELERARQSSKDRLD